MHNSTRSKKGFNKQTVGCPDGQAGKGRTELQSPTTQVQVQKQSLDQDRSLLAGLVIHTVGQDASLPCLRLQPPRGHNSLITEGVE